VRGGVAARWIGLGALLAAVVLVSGSSASSAVLMLTYPSAGACAQGPTGLNACIASATDGSTITIKPGTYFEHGTLIGHSVTVTGSCGLPTSVVIDQAVAGDGFDVHASNVTIKCLTVRHGASTYNGIFNAGAYNGLHVTQVDAFDEEYAVNQGTSGTTGLSVTSSKFIGTNNVALYSSGVTGATVTGNTIENADNDCLEFASLKKSTVSNNIVGVCAGDGILIGGGANDTVSTNKLTTSGSTCIFAAAAAVSITANTIDGCSGPAIDVSGNYPTITTNQIAGQVSGATIEVQCGDNAVITGNTATGGNDNNYFIDVCQQNGSSETITNNTEAQGFVLFGLYCSPCDNATVTGNKLLGGGSQSGVYVAGHDPVVNGNTVAGGWNSFGIYVDCTAACLASQVEKNLESASNSSHGYELLNNGNPFVGCAAGDSGFDIENVGNTLTMNTASGNACDGFFVNANGNELDGNTATGNFAMGFQVAQALNSLDKNTSTGNDGDGFNNDGTNTVFTTDHASGNRQDCTNDATGGETATVATNTGNVCADGTNFSATSTLTGW
jgi:parallel beta-helix repeat protein/putative cofactor-binding repeat protein